MNNNTHPCANKCSEFKNGGQCFHCLINETVNRGVYSMHRTEHRIDLIVEPNDMGDDAHIENHISPLCVSKSSENESQDYLAIKTDAQIIAELKVENKKLHVAAATHLRNQHHFKGLYDALVEQLYPYAIDLEDPVDGDVNITPPEFTNGYNRARECVHYNLLEMMESDVEYIRMQCDMLGGGGEA